MKSRGLKIKPVLGKDGHPVFRSLSAAKDWLRGLKARLKKRAAAEEFPITTSGDHAKFLLYSIGLLNPMDYPTTKRQQIVFYKNLLTAMANGYSKKWIARMSGCSEETFDKHEIEAKKYVKEAINRVQKYGTPIVGGKG